MDELLQAHTENDDGTRHYEVGYHLLPTFAEESVAGEVAKIKDLIVAQGGAVSSEEMPKKITLAYRIAHAVGNARSFFDSAYFGWVRFELSSANVSLLERELKNNTAVLRFIVLVTPHGKVSPAPRGGSFGHKTPPVAENMLGVKEKGSRPERETLTEAELDKTIEELIR